MKLENLLHFARLYFKAHHCKPKLRVSVSGGRTSMFMAKWCKDNLSEHFDILYLFGNTSREHADTYRFLRAGDEAFGLGVVTLEAVVHHGIRKACTARVVQWDDLATDGRVFREVSSAYGVPNQTFKLCTRELKTNPMDDYAESVGWGDALVAIGIRADEKRRVSNFEQFDWDLRISEWDGNCVDCHKKSDRKLQQVYLNTPEVFDWSIQLEDDFKFTGPNNVPGPRKRFRGYRDTRELIASFQGVPASALSITDGGCSESCEVYETEEVA